MICTVGIGMGSALTYNEDAGGLSQHTVTTTMTAVCCGLLLSYVVFLATIKRSHVWTFLDTRTGCDYIQDEFKNSKIDAHKLGIFTKNEHKWKAAIGEEVKVWLQSRLEVWLESQPQWFDDYIKSTVPDWAVDDPAMLACIRNNKVEAIREFRKRRSSVAALIRGQGAPIAPIEVEAIREFRKRQSSVAALVVG